MQQTYTAPDVPNAESIRADRSWSRGASSLGIFLIIAGVISLAVQFLPGIGWAEMWPLIFVIVGVSQMIVPGFNGWSFWQLVEGLGSVLFGLVLLGNTTGFIDWTMWITFISLWPAMLVAAGLGLLGKATSQGWVRVLGAVVMWGILAYSAAVGAGFVDAPSLLVPWFWV